MYEGDKNCEVHIPEGVTEGEGVIKMVLQMVLFSSSPPGQSVAPSHNMLVEMQVLSLQANWSGAQVTVTYKEI